MKIGFNAIEIVLYGIVPTTIAAIIYVYYKNIKQSRKTLNFIFNSGHFWKK